VARFKALPLFSKACPYSSETGNSVNDPTLNRNQSCRYLSIELMDFMTYREIILLSPNTIYLDVGVNIDLYSCLAYLPNPKRILAFEPLLCSEHAESNST